MAIIETKDLAYRYSPGTPFEKTAVDGVNIQVEKGEFLGVIGHTGSGKSTLIRCSTARCGPPRARCC